MLYSQIDLYLNRLQYPYLYTYTRTEAPLEVKHLRDRGALGVVSAQSADYCTLKVHPIFIIHINYCRRRAGHN